MKWLEMLTFSESQNGFWYQSELNPALNDENFDTS